MTTLNDPVAAAGTTVPYYPDGTAELADHLLRLNRLLRLAVARFRRDRPAEQRTGLDGVAIFDDEIDRFLDSALTGTALADNMALAGHTMLAGDTGAAGADLAGDRLRCESRAAASADLGIELPVDLIRMRFRLSDLEVDALLHCVAPELHPGYGRLFAYLNNDITRQRPSVALIVEVLCPSWAERLKGRRELSTRSALFRFGLVTARPGTDHLAAELAVEPSVLEFALSGRPARGGRGLAAAPGLDDLIVSPEERAAAGRVTGYLGRVPRPALESTVVVISGAPGVGRRTCAEAICLDLGWHLGPVGKDAPAAAFGAGITPWLRDARLLGEVPGVYVPPGQDDEPSCLPLAIQAAAAVGGPAFVFVTADEPPRLADTGQADVLRLHLSAPGAGPRSRVWRQALGRQGLRYSDEAVARVAATYPFTVSRIQACAREAGLRARIEGARAEGARAEGAQDEGAQDEGAQDEGAAGDITTLAQICRGQVRHHLERLAQAVPSHHSWDDLILPADEIRRLKEIASAVRHRDRVMEEWGFGRKLSAGPGVSAIFFGPSGTGKTMAASILAAELGVALYRVDLSRVVSKYIGETERNLDALFGEARRSCAMLLFDEAEALFGKRSEVKDAHDRYANIEVAYLLQRMEQFEGIAVLATNLRKHLDTAFLRRLQFAVEFPLPATADRLRIWRQVWPGHAVLGGDLDLEFMAAQLELSGGHIRNVALTAAYLAAEGASPISMKHLVAATRREMQKLGRGCVPGQFGRYASLFEDGPAA